MFDKNHQIELTINQVKTRDSIARNCENRDNRVSSFLSYLRLDDFEGDSLVNTQPGYFQMTHGYQTEIPNFVVLGIPNKISWEGSIDISREVLLLGNNLEFETVATSFESPNLEELVEAIEGE